MKQRPQITETLEQGNIFKAIAMTENPPNGAVGDVPEDANKRKDLRPSLSPSLAVSDIYTPAYFFFASSFADCPGTEAEEAGKAEACAGCPNQQICATAPKGPDPGMLLFCVDILGRIVFRFYSLKVCVLCMVCDMVMIHDKDDNDMQD